MKKVNNSLKSLVKDNKKNPDRFIDEASVRIKFAQEIYDVRNSKKLSQQELATLAETTQKVISKIESAEVNIGIDLLQRVVRSLELTFKVGDVYLVTPNYYTDRINTCLNSTQSFNCTDNNAGESHVLSYVTNNPIYTTKGTGTYLNKVYTKNLKRVLIL